MKCGTGAFISTGRSEDHRAWLTQFEDAERTIDRPSGLRCRIGANRPRESADVAAVDGCVRRAMMSVLLSCSDTATVGAARAPAPGPNLAVRHGLDVLQRARL
jgi:hypothetical protein